MPTDHPKLRPLEAFPYRDQGRTWIVLRDPAHVSEQVLAVSPEVSELLPLLNGRNSLLDIQAEISRRRGRLCFSDEIRALIDSLDQAFFLENDKFRAHQLEVIQAFHDLPARKAYHAGKSYPGDGIALNEMLTSFYCAPKGPGLPQRTPGKSVRALLAPHIDLSAGGATYAHAYAALAESQTPDLFIVLGVAHAGLPSLFSISPKDFETPLGLVQADRAFLQVLRQEIPAPLFDEDFSHRYEHTIEFQLLFLKHLYREACPPVVPILCSFLYGDLVGDAADRRALLEQLTAAISVAERESGKQACLIAGVDLAHIGPRYGDAFRPDQGAIDSVMNKDREMLQQVCACRPEEFLRLIATERDARRVCGFPAILTALYLSDGCQGDLLHHSYALVDELGSFVTFAGVVFRN